MVEQHMVCFRHVQTKHAVLFVRSFVEESTQNRFSLGWSSILPAVRAGIFILADLVLDGHRSSPFLFLLSSYHGRTLVYTDMFKFHWLPEAGKINDEPARHIRLLLNLFRGTHPVSAPGKEIASKSSEPKAIIHARNARTCLVSAPREFSRKCREREIWHTSTRGWCVEVQSVMGMSSQKIFDRPRREDFFCVFVCSDEPDGRGRQIVSIIIVRRISPLRSYRSKIIMSWGEKMKK